MDFIDYDFIITKIICACAVPAGTGDAVHNNRPSHGLALNVAGEKAYTFGKNCLSVKENDIIFLPEKSDYIVENVVSGNCYAVNFKISEQINFEPFVLHLKKKTLITDLFVSIEKSFRMKNNGYQLKCKSKLYALLYAIFEEYHLTYTSAKQKELIMPALKYIHEFYSEQNFTVSFLSKRCGIAESYFRRIFFNNYGMSPIKYINMLKLTRAKELLSQSEYSIEAVSEMAGFNNTYYFCRYFKREIGTTPSEYRKDVLSGRKNSLF